MNVYGLRDGGILLFFPPIESIKGRIGYIIFGSMFYFGTFGSI